MARGQIDPAWLCAFCREAVQVGQPFTPLLVRGRNGTPLQVVTHYACTLEALAKETADRVLEMLDEAADPSSPRPEAGGDLGGIIAGRISEFVRDFFT